MHTSFIELHYLNAKNKNDHSSLKDTSTSCKMK